MRAARLVFSCMGLLLPVHGRTEEKPETHMIIAMRTGQTHLEDPRSEADRTLELEVLSAAFRYHFIATEDEAVRVENAQHLQALKVRLRLDRKGRVNVRAGVFPGVRFSSGWNDTGWGTGEGALGLRLKQFYLSVQPRRGIEAEWGGLGIAYGESTEVTSYDYDGYLTGERVSAHEPGRLWFDEISVSVGYLSAADPPGFFSRLERLADVNYGQFLARKELKSVRFSLDYTRHSESDTFRQAIHVETPGSVVMDAIRFEMYERAGSAGGFGLGLYGQKRLGSRLSVGAGYARVGDSLLNSDRFPAGESVYGNALLRLSGELSLMAAVTSTSEAGVAERIRTRLDIALGVDLLPRLGMR
jgi:hypothetical protein